MRQVSGNGVGLVIDTTICGLRLALQPIGAGEGPAWSASHNESLGSAAKLTDLLREGLVATSIDPRSVVRILVSCGPGSFTGIRVGLAFAQGFFAGVDKRAEGCSSLGLYAMAESRRRGSPVDVFLPATQAAGYIARVGWVGGSPGEVVLMPFAVDAAGMDIPQDGRISLVAGNWTALVNRFANSGSIRYEVIPLAEMADGACAGMCRRLAASVSQTDHDGIGLQPLYLRRSSVEEKMRGNS